MNYVPFDWKSEPSGGTPVTAVRLNALEQGVADADERAPKWVTVDGRLMVLLDAAKRETWLGANSVDGGPTPWALEHLQRSLGIGVQPVPGYLLALADSERRMTDLAIRDTDGQLADFVVDRLRPRILAGYEPPAPPTPRSYADTRWVDGSDMYPVSADSTRAAGFGESNQQALDSRLSTLFAGHGVSYYGGGKGSERAEHIAARLGSVPALLTVVGGGVPASGPVAVTTPTMPLSSALRTYSGVLAGVPGSLSYNAADTSFRFTRASAGVVTEVPADTPFIPDASVYRDAIMILWMGKNSLGRAGGDAVAIERLNTSFDWLAPFTKRCLVIGHWVNRDTPPGGDLQAEQVGIFNAAARKRYGRLFVDVGAYVTSAQVWLDTGITPTPEDLSHQALGYKPPSLSDSDGHLNDAGNDAVTNFLIAPRLRELDWLRTNRKIGTAPAELVTNLLTTGTYLVSATVGTVVNGYPTTSPGVLEVVTDTVSGATTHTFTTVGASGAAVVFRRNKPAGGAWAAGWSTWAPASFNNGVGRRFMAWDRDNSRDQLIYGDTGWRNISSLLGVGHLGGLYIRRVGSQISLAGDIKPATGLTTLNGTFLSAVPAGFGGRGAPWTHTAVRTVDNVTWFSLQRQGDALLFSNGPVLVDTSNCRFEISWSTTAAWPSVLPGVADGAIPII